MNPHQFGSRGGAPLSLRAAEIRAENKNKRTRVAKVENKTASRRRLRTIKSCLSSCNYKINERDAGVVLPLPLSAKESNYPVHFISLN
jgi:hypothetical protein